MRSPGALPRPRPMHRPDRGSGVPVLRGQPEAARGIALGVELDEDGGLISHHLGVVAGLDDDASGCGEIERAAVAIPAPNTPAREKADVRMHAELRANE